MLADKITISGLSWNKALFVLTSFLGIGGGYLHKTGLDEVRAEHAASFQQVKDELARLNSNGTISDARRLDNVERQVSSMASLAEAVHDLDRRQQRIEASLDEVLKETRMRQQEKYTSQRAETGEGMTPPL